MHTNFAILDEKQLKKIIELENEWNVILIAYNKAITDKSFKESRINQIVK